MFSKPVQVKPYSAVKSSEQRNILQTVQKQFNLPDLSEHKQVLVPKSVQQARGITAGGDKIQIYAENQQPLYVILKSQIIPTVELLSRLPLGLQLQFMPVVYTVPNTIQFLQKGADFMIPGIFGDLPESCPAGSLVQVREVDSKALMMVGYALCDLSKVDVNERGRGVQNINACGDKLTPNTKCTFDVPSSTSNPVEPTPADAPVDTPETSAETPEKPLESLNIDEYDQLSMAEADEAFDYAVLKTTRQPHTYPMSMAGFAALLNENMPYFHPEMNIKATSYKKMGKLLKHFEKNGRLALRERQGGEVMVLSVNVPPNEKLEPPKTPKTKQKPKMSKQDMLQGLNFYKPKPQLRAIFTNQQVAKTEILEANAIKTEVSKYLKAHLNVDKLIASQTVQLTDELRTALGQKQTVTQLPVQDIVKIALTQCTLFHKIVQPHEDPASIELQKGGIPKINIKTERRGGNKVVTLVQTAGIKGFQINPAEFAEELRHACAGSSTVSDVKGHECIVVQGNHVDKIKKILNKKGIQNAWIA